MSVLDLLDADFSLRVQPVTLRLPLFQYHNRERAEDKSGRKIWRHDKSISTQQTPLLRSTVYIRTRIYVDIVRLLQRKLRSSEYNSSGQRSE